jgi:hypothetical protein
VRKISPPPGCDPWTVQPLASRYNDWAIPAPPLRIALLKNPSVPVSCWNLNSSVIGRLIWNTGFRTAPCGVQMTNGPQETWGRLWRIFNGVSSDRGLHNVTTSNCPARPPAVLTQGIPRASISLRVWLDIWNKVDGWQFPITTRTYCLSWWLFLHQGEFSPTKDSSACTTAGSIWRLSLRLLEVCGKVMARF